MGGFLSGRTSLTTVQTADLAANAVTTAKILDGAVTAGKLASGAGGASTSDMRLAFLMIAENQGDRLNLDDGIADPFKDETDIDTSTSTNETYNAAGDFYSSSGGYDANAVPDMTNHTVPSGTVTASTEYSGSWYAWQAFDRDPTLAKSWLTAAGNLTGWLAYEFTGSKTIKKYTVTAGYGGDLRGPRDWTFDGWNGSAWIELDAQADQVFGDGTTVKEYEISNSTAYIKYRFNITESGGGSSYVGVGDLTMHELSAPVNVTLVSNAFTATAVPATGRIHIQVNPVDAITINTDLTAEISRDSGTTWTVATLALTETLKDGTLAYEDNAVTISGQPSGTAMKYRVKTLNAKHIEIHGAVLQWST
jgi:hypothetical protein